MMRAAETLAIEPKLPVFRMAVWPAFCKQSFSRFDRNSRAGVDRKPGEQRFCFNATRANGTAFSGSNRLFLSGAFAIRLGFSNLAQYNGFSELYV